VEAARLRPDLMLMDIRMPNLDGIEATRRLAGPGAAADPVRVLVLTTYDVDEYVFEALRAGACGFLLKHTSPEGLVEAVRTVASGDGLIAPAVTRRLIARVAGSGQDRRARARQLLDRLNQREREVAVAVGQGRSNAEIGSVLYLSVPTVKTHVSSILAKLDLNNRVQIALLVHDAGLLDEQP
jgi:DNA-binding NarL/FixJ family response regulator